MQDDAPTMIPQPVEGHLPAAVQEAAVEGHLPAAVQEAAVEGYLPAAVQEAAVEGHLPAAVQEATVEGHLPAAVQEETVEGVPVLAEVRPIERVPQPSLPAVQAAAVAATSFVAGAATLALVKRHSARKLARAARSRPPRPADLLPIVGTRTFLVDVHLIAKPQQ